MIEYAALGLLAGVATGVTPCVLPVLPVIVAYSTQTRRRWGALAVCAGLATGFAVVTLLGTRLLQWAGLSLNLWRDLGLIALVVAGLVFLIPAVEHLVQRPFARLGAPRLERLQGWPLGLALGLVFVPCAGPVLAAITVVGASRPLSAGAVTLTVFFAVGVSVPLGVVALAGRGLSAHWAAVRRHAARLRHVVGAILILTAVAINFGWLTPVEGALPNWTLKAVGHIGDAGSQATALRGLEHSHTAATSPSTLLNFTGNTGWVAAGPLTAATLAHKVVLVDFFTYSCINCQRELPHVEAWWRQYRSSGLVVVGVETPEFAFEHVRSNVVAALPRLGVTFPVVTDNDYAVWDSFNNLYWPAEYLFSAAGKLVYTSFGEGDYGVTQSKIRGLLAAAGARVPPSVNTPSVDVEAGTPESYLGADRIDNDDNATLVTGRAADYRLPTSVPFDDLAFGGVWTVLNQRAVAGAGAEIALHYEAKDVYLVMAGTGTITVDQPGQAVRHITVSGIPDLYTMVAWPSANSSTVTLHFTPGLSAYDFTFG